MYNIYIYIYVCRFWDVEKIAPSNLPLKWQWVGLELVMRTVERGFLNTLGLADGHPTGNMEFSSTWRIIQVSK